MADIKANKQGNNYYLQAGRDVFEACPKAVWAAIAISSLTCGGDELEQARERILSEWQALYDNGIVPQKLPAALARGTSP